MNDYIFLRNFMTIKNIFMSAMCSACIMISNQCIAKTDLENLPSYETWLEHASYLEKFWLHKDARGVPEGNFPTWRCNDGTLRNQSLCPYERDIGQMQHLTGIDFVRMNTRQTFAYGALFNITGNKEALRLHMAGVKFLLEKIKDKEGGYHVLLEKGEPLGWPKDAPFTDYRLARTSQDLSYVLMALSMNAYLTHDKKIIDELIEAQKYIYDTYYDKEKGIIRWCFSDTYFDKKEQVELVAMLDQLNAYLLLSWRLMPDTYKAEWGEIIRKTIKDMNKNFYSKKLNRFYGCTHDKSCFDTENGRHMDNGHRVKTFWMEYLAALALNDNNLANFAKKGMIQTLNGALTKNKNDWYGDDLQRGADWWVYAELDQSALTLALSNDYDMPDTLNQWVHDFTDKEYGEIKNFGLKTWFWRNGFHSTEHALIGTILSNAIRAKQCTDDKCRNNNTTTLHFAPVDSNDTNFTPYYYSGDITDVKRDGQTVSITFTNVDLPKAVK